MNNFLTEWGKDLKSIPVGPLGIIAMAGCEEMGQKVDSWLQDQYYEGKLVIHID